MRVLLIAYVKANLGDDLFVKTILERYPNVEFFINAEKEEFAKSYKKYNNINVISEKRDLNKIDIDFYDAYIYVGGSIFIENTAGGIKRLIDFRKFVVDCKDKGKPFFYLSCNFGPFETQEYLETGKNLFKECKNICFRDTYSKKLFENINTVMYAPDLVFSLDIEKKDVMENTVGISMIDISKVKGLEHLENTYYKCLQNNVKNYIKQGKNVYLFSFCKYAGEEEAIEKFIKLFSEEENSKIYSVKYDGDMEKFLEVYSKMEYMICIKFHAMILSTIFGQKKIVLSYFDKLNRVNDDLKLTEKLFDLKDITEDMQFCLDMFDVLGDGKVNSIVKSSQKQFERIDEILRNKNISD